MRTVIPPVAHINPTSERAADWLRVYGGMEAPIESPIPTRAIVMGVEREVYFVDILRLTPDQKRNLVDHIAERFEISRDEVVELLPGFGCPILADEVSVIFDARAFL